MSENKPQPNTKFDVVGFDAAHLDFSKLIEHIQTLHCDVGQTAQLEDWFATCIVKNDRRTIYRLDPMASDKLPTLKVKIYHDDPPLALRAFQVKEALLDFGISIGPRPFYCDDMVKSINGGLLICEWIHGDALANPPSVEDEENWHRIMAVMGVLKNLAFGKYAAMVPMQGRGPQKPQDVFDLLDHTLALLNEDHSDYEGLSQLVANAKSTVMPDWVAMPKIALSRLDTDIQHFIWDGHHMRGISWHTSDWADVAYDVGQLASAPAYEEIPASHWVWFRWEYGRLTHDEGMVARSTTYTHLLMLYWAIQLTVDLAATSEEKHAKRLISQRDRYLKKAQKAFSE